MPEILDLKNTYPKIQNQNELHQDNFKLVLRNLRVDNHLRDFEFMCQAANIPGIQVPSIRVQTLPNYINVPASKLYYDDLVVLFKVDEDLNNYWQLVSWMTGITGPQDKAQFETYQGSAFPKQYITSVDASLFALTNAFNPNVEIAYRNVFPTQLSSIDFDFKSTNDIIQAQVQFKFDYFEIKKQPATA
jgi:hypothetical protein